MREAPISRPATIKLPSSTAYATATQNFSAGQWNKVLFDHVEGETVTGRYDASTSRFTPGVAGAAVIVFVSVRSNGSTPANTAGSLELRRNGAEVALFSPDYQISGGRTVGGIAQAYVAAATDYLEVWLYATNGFTSDLLNNTLFNRVTFQVLPPRGS